MVNNVAKTKSQNLLSKYRQLPAHLQNVFESGQVGLDKDQNKKLTH
jgi:enamine deaminase RidA (YjgF/YER057c/UK114 family)